MDTEGRTEWREYGGEGKKVRARKGGSERGGERQHRRGGSCTGEALHVNMDQ